jgi:hypothetical protein
MLLKAAITVIRQNKSERTLKSITLRISFGVGLQKKQETIPHVSAAESTTSFFSVTKILFINVFILLRYNEVTPF